MRKYRLFLKNSKEYRSIASSKTTKNLIAHMSSKSGNLEATRKGIANVYVKFYNVLYSGKNAERKDDKDCEARRSDNIGDNADNGNEDDEQDRHIPELTKKELMIETDSLKKVE